jgi:hypothetical protein
MKDFLHGFHFMAMLVVYVSDRSCTILNERTAGPSAAPLNRPTEQLQTDTPSPIVFGLLQLRAPVDLE